MDQVKAVVIQLTCLYSSSRNEVTPQALSTHSGGAQFQVPLSLSYRLFLQSNRNMDMTTQHRESTAPLCEEAILVL